MARFIVHGLDSLKNLTSATFEASSEQILRRQLEAQGWTVYNLEEDNKIVFIPSTPNSYQSQEQQFVTPLSQEANAQKLIYASFWRRLTAFIIDIIALNIINLIFMSIYNIIFPSLEIGGLFISLFTAYNYFLLDSHPNATLGKALMNIVVTDEEGKSNYSPGFRVFVKIISFIFFIGPLFLTITLLFTKKKRGLHDLASGSVVVLRRTVT
jgi:uncharacterized RDD family membrane protein YckC